MRHRISRVSAIALAALGSSAASADNDATQTPIKHIIVLIGENHSFDNVFATYKASRGQSVGNLLARGIIKPDGSPGPNSAAARQYLVDTPLPARYFMGTGFAKTAYSPFLPTPDLGGAPNKQISPADLAADPTGVQPPFDNQFTRAQLASLEPSLEKSDLSLLRTGATGAAGTSGPDTRIANYATQTPCSH